MMTIDDEGEGGFWPMMTSSQKPKFSVNFWDFPRNFPKFFLKICKIRAKFSSKFNIKIT